MKRLLVLVCLLFVGFASAAQAPLLSSEARISILTFGPYQGELYSAFGHSAIRVYDQELGLDDAFNYGIFDFDQPNFYLNFARGNSFYKLGVYPYPLFRDHYVSYNRFIHEQILNLTPTQKQKIFEFLVWNARPENASYLYDYFYDNCATRVRDVFPKILPGEVKFDTTFIQTDYSIRDLTDLYLSQQPWGDLGIDICLGLPMDKKASPYEYMFLPDYIEYSFDHATVKYDSAWTPLVKEKLIVYKSVPEARSFHWYHPWIVFGLLLAGVGFLSYRDWKRKKISKWFDITLFGTCGLIGVVLFLLWTATSHKAAATNFNLLWALPTHLVGAILLMRKQSGQWAQKYFTFVEIVTGILLAFWWIMPQQLNLFLIPFVLVILLRSLLISWLLKPGSVAA